MKGVFYVNYQIIICDTGVGISPEGMKNLFLDFGKLDENSERNKSGTGLGLSICKQII
jgi:signal transduction histidine kinase